MLDAGIPEDPGNEAFAKVHDALDRLSELLDDPDDGNEPGEADAALTQIKNAGQYLLNAINNLSVVDFNEEYAEVAEGDAPEGEEDDDALNADTVDTDNNPFVFLS